MFNIEAFLSSLFNFNIEAFCFLLKGVEETLSPFPPSSFKSGKADN